MLDERKSERNWTSAVTAAHKKRHTGLLEKDDEETNDVVKISEFHSNYFIKSVFNEAIARRQTGLVEVMPAMWTQFLLRATLTTKQELQISKCGLHVLVIKGSANEFTKPAVILKRRGRRKDAWLRLLIFKAKVKGIQRTVSYY